MNPAVDDDPYSLIAKEQIAVLEAGSDIDLYNTVLDACELVLQQPEEAQEQSLTALSTSKGICFLLPVVGHPPYKVFWSSKRPRIEAVMPYTT